MATLPEMVRALKKVFPNGPSWPFKTESARRVWEEADKLFDKHPDWSVSDIVRQAIADSGVSMQEFVPDDYAILSIAVRWKSYVLHGGRKYVVPMLAAEPLPPPPPPPPMPR